MTATTDKLDLQDVVNELTQPIHHREPYGYTHRNRDGTSTWIGKHHPTEHPSLITQLELACRQTPTNGDTGDRPGYDSKPTARIDAIDALLRIDQEASRWLRNLQHQTSRELTTAQLVRRIATHANNNQALEKAIRSWYLQARILTGWDSPAWRPDNTCPACGRRGALRVKMTADAAMCVECQATWDRDAIGILAAHIRRENHEDDQPDDTQNEAAS